MLICPLQEDIKITIRCMKNLLTFFKENFLNNIIGFFLLAMFQTTKKIHYPNIDDIPPLHTNRKRIDSFLRLDPWFK